MDDLAMLDDEALAARLSAEAIGILKGRAPTSFISGVAARDQLRRAHLLKGPTGRERLTGRARRIAALAD